MAPLFKIISTLGPASFSEDFVRFCAKNRQPYFRLNGSHVKPEQLETYAALIARTLHNIPFQIYLDLQGNKLRIGEIPGEFQIDKGTSVRLNCSEKSESGKIPVPDEAFFVLSQPGDLLFLQDGTVELQVLDKEKLQLTARCIRSGKIRSKCGIVINGKSIVAKKIPQRQIEQVKTAQKLNINNLALSFVENADNLLSLRNLCSDLNYHPTIIAKIERPRALQNLDDLVNSSDETWFCRGDLGAMIPLKNLGKIQDVVIFSAVKSNVPVYIAGQVFQYLVHNNTPTRSEVVHFFHLQEQKVSGVVLSDETAIGKDPVTAVKQILSLC